MHSGDPVPLLLAGTNVRTDRVKTFSELASLGGSIGRILGKDLMPLLLDASGRTVELGTRPTPRKLNFVPKDLLPLDMRKYT
jgi:2,3-bisphosphoglycerate-independent phosphoglycerate mutase